MTYTKTSERWQANTRVSVVIPVYNEAERIGDCLRTIAAQTVRPYEVIVVDNNSTDATAIVVAQFPFVRLVRERRQGVVYARRRGFDEARGDIIGSLDADSAVPGDWVQTIQRIFADDNVHAVAGVVIYRDIAWTPLINAIDRAFRRYFAWLYAGRVPMQAANMAVRCSAWREARDRLCVARGIHEDLDLSAHLGEVGKGAVLDERLYAVVQLSQFALSWREFGTYAAAEPRSYSRHGIGVRTVWAAVVAVVTVYPLLWVLYKGYDVDAQDFSWVRVLRPAGFIKVNPVSFID